MFTPDQLECLNDPARSAEACAMLDDLQARVGLPEDVVQPQLVRIVAREFARVVRSWLDGEELAEVIRLNRAETVPGICHSHDFMDANDAMGEAFAICELPTCADIEGADEPELHEWSCRIWSDAWGLAQRNEFKGV